MKFSLSTLTLLLLSNVWAEEECTFGKLYLSEFNSSTVHIFDMNGAPGSALKEEAAMVVGTGNEFFLDTDSTSLIVSAVHRGTVAKNYMDGTVTWFNTSVYKEDHADHFHVETGTPSMITNAAFNCSRPIHYVRHDQKIAIFCDGSYTAPQVNTTVWVVDETKLNKAGMSAVVFSTTIPGTHHGVAVPIDDDHVMHSVALPERVLRNSTNSLPSTFQIVDYKGMPIHSLSDPSNKNLSCAGFHGSWAIGNTIVLACDANHGGVLVVNYDDKAKTYKSRALLYPPGYAVGHRTGSFAEDHKSPYVVGNFAMGNMSHLMYFKPTDMALTNANVQPLPLVQCAYAFEMSEAKYVLVFLPNGMLHAFKPDPWTEVAKVQVLPGMTACSQASMVPGYMRAYVMQPSSKTIYTVDLLGAMSGVMKVSMATIPFTPLSGVVAGVPEDAECKGDYKAPTTRPRPAPVALPVGLPVAAPKAAPVTVPVVAPVPVVTTPVAPVPVAATPKAAPVAVPVATPPVAPVAPVAKKCGLFGMSMFCPLTGCGLVGRLLGMCAN